MITEEKAAKLHKAIDLAEGYGACHYVRAGKPCCVIAQLAILEDVPLEQVELWPTATTVSGIDVDRRLPPPLRAYPLALLVEVQKIWDGQPVAATADQARGIMHDRVNRELETAR